MALRTRLVDTAVRAIERDGPEGLTLRRIASDAGVSRQAPYLCFAPRDARGRGGGRDGA